LDREAKLKEKEKFIFKQQQVKTVLSEQIKAQRE
jgi:hypothetical protein